MWTVDPLALPDSPPTGHALSLESLIQRRAQAVSEASSALWQALSVGLVQIIGHEGFNALYDRSLHEASITCAWLRPELGLATGPSRLEHLRATLADRQDDDARLATVLQLASFTALLSSLIGPHLTDHILRAAWGDDFDHTPPES